jgi:two-component system sensor histidine kinase KdpD
LVPSAICALTAAALDTVLDVSGESAVFFIGVLIVALLGGVAPAALSAVLSGLLLNYFFVDPRYTFTIANPDSAITIFVLFLVAVAVAALVDSSVKRSRLGGTLSVSDTPGGGLTVEIDLAAPATSSAER